MPQRRNSLGAPPPVMTWGKAAFVLTLCVIFDAASAFFAAFWITGPAFAGLLCTGIGNATVGSLGGITAALCGAGATAAGYVFSPALTAFGAVMAMMVGLIAWGTIGLLLMISNRRIFKETGQILWFIGGLAVDQMPVINAIPALTPVLSRLYRAQIKREQTQLAEHKRQMAWMETRERVLEAEAYRDELLKQAEEAEQSRIPDAAYEAA